MTSRPRFVSLAVTVLAALSFAAGAALAQSDSTS